MQAEMREGADTADATRSGEGYLRMLTVIAGLLTVWVLFFVAFLSSYSDWGSRSATRSSGARHSRR